MSSSKMSRWRRRTGWKSMKEAWEQGVEPVLAGGEHERLEEQTGVDERAGQGVGTRRQDHPDGRAEELVVAPVVAVPPLAVPGPDPEGPTVELVTELRPAGAVG